MYTVVLKILPLYPVLFLNREMSKMLINDSSNMSETGSNAALKEFDRTYT